MLPAALVAVMIVADPLAPVLSSNVFGYPQYVAIPNQKHAYVAIESEAYKALSDGSFEHILSVSGSLETPYISSAGRPSAFLVDSMGLVNHLVAYDLTAELLTPLYNVTLPSTPSSHISLVASLDGSLVVVAINRENQTATLSIRDGRTGNEIRQIAVPECVLHTKSSTEYSCDISFPKRMKNSNDYVVVRLHFLFGPVIYQYVYDIRAGSLISRVKDFPYLDGADGHSYLFHDYDPLVRLLWWYVDLDHKGVNYSIPADIAETRGFTTQVDFQPAKQTISWIGYNHSSSSPSPSATLNRFDIKSEKFGSVITLGSGYTILDVLDPYIAMLSLPSKQVFVYNVNTKQQIELQYPFYNDTLYASLYRTDRTNTTDHSSDIVSQESESESESESEMLVSILTHPSSPGKGTRVYRLPSGF